MNTTVTSRLVAAFLSVCTTLVLLNAVALLGYPSQTTPGTQLAKTTAVVAMAAGHSHPTH